ncbi:hypothetical protein GCM10010274_11810 [Streptomyces lavendofoliae]|uniref:Uncharacterized protein n=1 Tax=Streptomyces lavendofoliae TaxID=67314 RepID=A0A918HUX7_9ACTN|nr:hypothetical protein GCM10010274_11810 [Streptomyces lavendofoliae]
MRVSMVSDDDTVSGAAAGPICAGTGTGAGVDRGTATGTDAGTGVSVSTFELPCSADMPPP